MLIISVYVVLAVIKLGHPGLQYDELLFGNAALGNSTGIFIHKVKFGIPIMLMPYIGALKAYIYYPIFAVFETSYATVRLPMIFLTAVSLWLIYKFVSKGADFSVAVLSILFLAADACFISLTRTDVGPVAIGLFFRCLALLYFFKFVENRGGKNIIIICGALLLGFYDKLNFIWFIIAFAVAAIVFYGTAFGNITEIFKKRAAQIAALTLALIFIGLARSVYQLGVINEITLIPTPEHISMIYKNWLGLATGSAFYEYLIGDWGDSRTLGWIIWSVICGGSILAFCQPKSKIKTFHFFNLLILFLVFVQILLTDKATAPWHVFMLQPTMAILTASSLKLASEMIFRRSNLWQKTILAGAAITIFGIQFFTYSMYIAAYEKPYRNIMWSKKIDELYAYTQTVPNRFVSLDWGFHPQLLTLERNPGKYYDAAFIFVDPIPPTQLRSLESDFMNPDSSYLFIMHDEANTHDKSARRRFFEVSEQLGLKPQLVKSFDEAEKPLYEVYRLERK